MPKKCINSHHLVTLNASKCGYILLSLGQLLFCGEQEHLRKKAVEYKHIQKCKSLSRPEIG